VTKWGVGTLRSQTEAVGQAVSCLENLRGELDQLNLTVENHDLWAEKNVEIPMKADESLEGII
jgi:hypothetical protein